MTSQTSEKSAEQEAEAKFALETFRLKFTSGNEVHVERATVIRKEYDAVQGLIVQLTSRIRELENERDEERAAHWDIGTLLLSLVGTDDGTSVGAARKAAKEITRLRTELTKLREGNPSVSRDEVIEECCRQIQAECTVCGGSGGKILGEHFVTHDMALDAGEPAMEGQSMGVESEQCEYCGRPIEAIRNLKVDKKEEE